MVELSGDYEFAAPPELVWEMFLDPEVLARIMPGCEKLELVNEGEYQGRMKLQVGPVQGVFQGTVTLSDLEAPRRCHLLINGRGAPGIVRGEGDVELQTVASGTNMAYSGSAEVSGRMATVGQRLMSSSAKSITNQSLQNLEKQIEARMHPPVAEVAESETAAAAAPAVASAAAPAAPSETEFMLGVAHDMFADLIPDPQQRRLVLGAGVMVMVFGLANVFANMVARRVVRMMRAERS